MIEIIKNDLGYITAVCEYQLVNDKGEISKEGNYIFVNDLEIIPEYRKNGIIRTFINRISEKFPQAEFAYWERDKYLKNGKSRISIYRRFNIYTRRVKDEAKVGCPVL